MEDIVEFACAYNNFASNFAELSSLIYHGIEMEVVSEEIIQAINEFIEEGALFEKIILGKSKGIFLLTLGIYPWDDTKKIIDDRTMIDMGTLIGDLDTIEKVELSNNWQYHR